MAKIIDKISIEKCPIGNMRLERKLNKYYFSARVGEYYEFNYSKISNERHHHHCYELVLVLSGKATFLYKNKSYQLKEGGVFLSEPDNDHEIHINPNENMVLLYIMFDLTIYPGKQSRYYEERILDQFLEGHMNNVENQYQLFSYILFFEDYINNNGSGNDIFIKKSLENFIFNCLEALVKNKPHPDSANYITENLYEKALNYIDENLSSRITADLIAESISTSKRNLYRIFKKNMDRSVNDYVNERKIFLAGYYLKMNMSVTQSANLIGIENLSQFNKLFHRYLDMSPRAYREIYKKSEGYGRRFRE